MAYETPTYQSYDDPREQWREWKRQAYTLPVLDVARHASVSRSNRHACGSCFCCACVEVLGEIKAAGDVTRYVVTVINKDGDRVLAHAAQGRNTYATPEAAQAWINAARKNNSADLLKHLRADTWEIRPCLCYWHHDPKGQYFEEAEGGSNA